MFICVVLMSNCEYFMSNLVIAYIRMDWKSSRVKCHQAFPKPKVVFVPKHNKVT